MSSLTDAQDISRRGICRNDGDITISCHHFDEIYGATTVVDQTGIEHTALDALLDTLQNLPQRHNATFAHSLAGIVLIGMHSGALDQTAFDTRQIMLEGCGMRRPRAQRQQGSEEKGAKPYARLDHAFWSTPFRLNL